MDGWIGWSETSIPVRDAKRFWIVIPEPLSVIFEALIIVTEFDVDRNPDCLFS